MRALSYIPAWVKNKYLLTIAGFLVWMLFFDDRDVFSTYFRQRTEENNLLQSKVYFEKQIRETREELDLLKLNTATIEKYAREKYLMKRDNEDLFLMTAQ